MAPEALDLLLALNQACSTSSLLSGLGEGMELERDNVYLLTRLGRVLPPVLQTLEYGEQLRSRSRARHSATLLQAVKALDECIQGAVVSLLDLQRHAAEHQGPVTLMCKVPGAWLDFSSSVRRLRGAVQFFAKVTCEFMPTAVCDTVAALMEVSAGIDAACMRAKDVAQIFGSDLRSVAISVFHTPGALRYLEQMKRLQQQNLTATTRLQQLPKLAALEPMEEALETTAGAGVASLISKVANMLLYDAEEDQLEQDRAFLEDRMAQLLGSSDELAYVESLLLCLGVQSRLRQLHLANSSLSTDSTESAKSTEAPQLKGAAYAKLLDSDTPRQRQAALGNHHHSRRLLLGCLPVVLCKS